LARKTSQRRGEFHHQRADKVEKKSRKREKVPFRVTSGFRIARPGSGQGRKAAENGRNYVEAEGLRREEGVGKRERKKGGGCQDPKNAGQKTKESALQKAPWINERTRSEGGFGKKLKKNHTSEGDDFLGNRHFLQEANTKKSP